MKFSVLMSIYIKEAPSNLNDCLYSIFNQTRLPDEIVLIKDGPLNNDLEEVINFYSRKQTIPFIIFQFEKNVGLGVALNKGVELCSNELIARMDTDDIAVVDRFEKQINYLEKNPEISLLGSHIKEFDQNQYNIRTIRIVPLNHKEIIKYAKKRNPFNHMTVVYKKSHVIDSGNYVKVGGVGYEDYDLWVRMIQKGYLTSNIDDFLVLARTGKNMYRRRGNKDRLGTALKFRRKLYISGFIGLSQYIKSYISTILFVLVPSTFREFLYLNFLRKKYKKNE